MWNSKEVNKLVIAVCEDNDRAREGLAACLKKAMARRCLDGQVAAFSSAEQMRREMNGRAFPVNFLDIYMEGTSGMELAWEIIKCDPKAAVVFATTSREHMAEGFCVGAVHYLVKPYAEADVGEALDRCLRLVDKLEPYMELSVGRENRKVLLSHIYMVEFRNRCCFVCTTEGDYRVYMRLEEMENRLADSRFLRCHRSYIVNLDHVSCITGNDFVLDNNAVVPIRREDKVKVKLAFQDYYFEKTRRSI